MENTPDAYPLAGLQNADIIYEELVEGGITRFIAVYQCKDATKVGPVRSARTTDPKVLVQFDARRHRLLGRRARGREGRQASGLVNFDESTGGAAFYRDTTRYAPHNLFLSTAELYAVGETDVGEGPPRRCSSSTRPRRPASTFPRYR